MSKSGTGTRPPVLTKGTGTGPSETSLSYISLFTGYHAEMVLRVTMLKWFVCGFDPPRFPSSTTVSSGRQSSVANDEVLTDFLRSLHVPDLVLPDRAFPRQNPKIQSLPKLDVGAANVFYFSKDRGFEDVMELPPEKKVVVSRSADRPYGFVEFHGDEKELVEEFVCEKMENLMSEKKVFGSFSFLGEEGV
ncbi:hypothetical protein LXL04_006714 [Taraxacum kok-saghyz]